MGNVIDPQTGKLIDAVTGRPVQIYKPPQQGFGTPTPANAIPTLQPIPIPQIDPNDPSTYPDNTVVVPGTFTPNGYVPPAGTSAPQPAQPAQPAFDGGGDYLANFQTQNQAYMDRLFSEQRRREGLINQAVSVFGKSDAEVKALQDADIASLRGVINDENIRARAGEYKQAFLNQSRPQLDTEIRRGRRLSRQALAQAGVGLSSIADDRRRKNTDQAIGAHNALNAQAFRIGADRETQGQQTSTNVLNSIISSYDRERARLSNNRQFALQRAGLGTQFDLGSAQLGIGSQLNAAKLEQLSDQFNQQMTFRGEELDIRKLLGIFGIESQTASNVLPWYMQFGDPNGNSFQFPQYGNTGYSPFFAGG